MVYPVKLGGHTFQGPTPLYRSNSIRKDNVVTLLKLILEERIKNFISFESIKILAWYIVLGKHTNIFARNKP